MTNLENNRTINLIVSAFKSLQQYHKTTIGKDLAIRISTRSNGNKDLEFYPVKHGDCFHSANDITRLLGGFPMISWYITIVVDELGNSYPVIRVF